MRNGCRLKMALLVFLARLLNLVSNALIDAIVRAS